MTKGLLEKTLRYRWYIFGILSIQYLIVYFHRVSPAVVAQDLIDAFSISATSLGILASAYFYPYGLMQIPVGILSDSLGPRKTLALFGLVSAVGAIGFGLSPAFDMAILSRTLVGLGVSAIFVSSMKSLAVWFRADEYGRISSILMAIGGIGWYCATTPLAFTAQSFGWRISFIIIGGVCLILTVLTWFILADTPERKGLAPIPGHVIMGSGTKRKILTDLSTILGERHFWPIAVWFIFRGGALFGFFGLWAGPYLTDVYGLSKSSTGNILSMIALAMVFISPVIGHLSDRTFGSRKPILVWSSVLNVLCFLAMVIWFDNLSLTGLYILFFLMGITISSVGTIAIASAKELFPLEIAGTAIGTINLFPFIGGIIFQPLMGYILDKGGKIGGAYHPGTYKTIVIFLFVTSILTLVSILFAKETMAKKIPR